VNRAVIVASLIGATLVVTAACWRSSPPPPAQPAAQSAPAPRRTPAPPRRDSALQVMEQFTDDMCSCHDSQCAQRVVDDMTRWSQEQTSSNREPAKMTEEDTQRAAEIGERMGACMQNAMAGSAAP
jgi:hypothetical protein